MRFPIDKEVILEGARSRLEPFKDATEAASLLEHIALHEKDLMKFSPSEFNSLNDLVSYFQQSLNERSKGSKYTFLVYDKLNETYAGSTSFGNISDANDRLEIGWTWIGKNFQRTGLNRHNKLLMLEFAFDKLNAARVELKSDARNLQSRKAMEGIGAKYEGQLRSHTVMSDGFRRDTVYYSILKDEWPTVRQHLTKERIR